MGFWRDVRKGLRSRGVYLDAGQARLILWLAKEGARSLWIREMTEKEREVLERFEKRCRELA